MLQFCIITVFFLLPNQVTKERYSFIFKTSSSLHFYTILTHILVRLHLNATTPLNVI